MQFVYTCSLLDVKPLFARDVANELNGLLLAVLNWPPEKRSAALEVLIAFAALHGITLVRDP